MDDGLTDEPARSSTGGESDQNLPVKSQTDHGEMPETIVVVGRRQCNSNANGDEQIDPLLRYSNTCKAAV